MRRLLRPAIVIPAVAVLLFAGGVVYAVTNGLDSGAVPAHPDAFVGG